MLRRIVKAGVANTLRWSGASGLIGAHNGKAGMPLILGYHRVVEDFREHAGISIAPMLIGLRTLEQQLDWLGRRYRFVDLGDAARVAASGSQEGTPVAAVSFDDGYRDVYEFAFPLLRRKGIPFAVFVITDFVGTPKLQAHDELYLLLSKAFAAWEEPRHKLAALLRDLDVDESALTKEVTRRDEAFSLTRVLLNQLSQKQLQLVMDALRVTLDPANDRAGEFRSLDWGQIIALHKAGVTIGSHTCSHALLTNEPHQKALREARDSRAILEQRLGTGVEHFAYPDGRFNREALGVVEEAGYRYAYTTCAHRDPVRPQLALPRRIMWEGACLGAFSSFSPSVMDCQVNGVFDFS
ncbi:MAG TPA: polysaccharide deacetylase family protein [Gammaproteobacteria bacterium]|nr:polysaccharide deacetylase family protein [Gammaproteobacteria bacterium]